MANSYIASVPKLRGRENYNEWAFAAENFLVLDGLKQCIDGTEDDAAKIIQARAKLILMIDTSLFIHIKETKTAEELWTKLKILYDDAGFSRRISLLRSLISARLEHMDNMASYVNHVIETSQRLRGTGFKIDEEWVGSLLLAGLPEKFSPMIMAIEHSGIEITTDSIKTKLLDMVDDKEGSAFIGKASWYKNHRADKYNGNKSHNPNVTSAKKEIRCYHCKQIGHYKSNCPVLKSNRGNQGLKSNNGNQEKANVFSAVFLGGQIFSKNDWYVDSGASVHLTTNKDWLFDVTSPKDLTEIVVANKSKALVKCTGNLNLTTVVEEKKFDVLVKDVLYVPQVATNLLSVSQLIKNGNKVIFGSDGCKIFNKDALLIGVARLVDNMYKLYTELPKQCFIASGTPVSGETWHRRLGHINEKELKIMTKGAVDGMMCKGKIKTSKQNCEVCNEGKQTRLSFPKKGSRASCVLEIVHADVCGPMEVKSLGGARYFLILKDDFSKMAFVYFLHTKEQVFEYFKQFKSMVENQVERKIKILRSDNGGEFCGATFENFLKQAGILHQKSNCYTPEQNGSAERLNRTVVERARCLLFDAKLDKKFWAEAVNTAVYLRNRSTISGLENRTPFEVWFGKKPDISNLRIFGSKVMTHIPKENRLKWDKKSRKMILVGYSETSKGYRLYDPVTNKININRDVAIMEEIKEKIQIVMNGNDKAADSVGDTIINEQLIEDTEEENSADTEHVKYTNCEDISDEEDCETTESPGSESRRSKRQPKPKEFKDFVTYMCMEGTGVDDPLTVEEVSSRPDAEMWKKAMLEELESFEENNAWEVVDWPKDTSAAVVRCKWVFKKKVSCEGVVRYRARLVAKGFSQKKGIDYEETFSPVVRFSSLRLLFALSVKLGLDISHLDVKTAFLNGYLKENVYMQIPESFVCSDENKCLKLKRAIYGLKQSSRAWNDRVNDVLLGLNYYKSKYEPCLYSKKENELITIIAVYVDDFFIFSNNENETDMVKSELSSKFKIKDLGRIKECLGMQVDFDQKNNVITLSQKIYITQLLKKFNMFDAKTVSTPMDVKVNLEDRDTNENIRAQYPYQNLIGSLMYLSVLTRPDISYSVSFLSQFNNVYNEGYWKCAKRILRYLKGTVNYCLRFSRDNLDIQGFVDADWASDTIDRRSYTGYAFKLCGSLVSWESSKQKTVALSSTEAEYMAISEAAKEAIYLRGLLLELTGNATCVTLYNDNQSALKLSVNPVYHKRSKHIDVRHHFIREIITNKLVKVEYMSTDVMPADILTKSLGSEKHYKLLKLLGIISL